MENARKPIENDNPSFENENKPIKIKYDGASGLRDLLLHELKSMYFIEKVLIKAFPKMIKNACTFELIEAITMHLEDTKKQIIRIEDTFSTMEENPILHRCEAIECMLQEIDDIVEVTKFGMVRDAGIVLALQKIEHYKMATYSILSTYAENLEEETVQLLLEQSLNEEKIAELRLAKIATSIKFYNEKPKL
jgi:ferritin-like metal-binding protein YciE